MAPYLHPAGMPWTLEIPFTRPGDVVRAAILKKRGAYYLCQLEEILTPSAERIQPKCLHFESCGGCRWQHTDYQEQLRLKESIVKHCFSDLLNPFVTFHPIIPCAEPWEYRNKMEFSFSSNYAGEKFLGLMIDSSHGKVLNLTECHLVHGWFIDALRAVREWWEASEVLAYHPYKDTGSLRTLIVREGLRTGDRMIMLTVSGNPEYALHKQEIASFIHALRTRIEPAEGEGKLSIFIRIQQVAKGRATEFYEMHVYGPDLIQEVLHLQQNESIQSLKFNVSPSAFFQPNTLQAEKLYSRVIQLANIQTDAIVYDLYCGTGTLGICIANHVKEVIGVELSPEAALDAKANISENGISNMRIFRGSVAEVLNQIKEGREISPPDVVVVDPPRVGLELQAIRLLLALKPSKIAYVSCNPASQSKDIQELVAGGYRLTCLQPVDQFPQTVHIENIAILEDCNAV
ncbi:MAG: 23S rRNA (uracil(1939)-C(5))-methyltransferase RlmD [Parachlamydiaceae bacterium]